MEFINESGTSITGVYRLPEFQFQPEKSSDANTTTRNILVISTEGKKYRALNIRSDAYSSAVNATFWDSLFQKKEDMYLLAISNILKQKDFLSLMYQLGTNQIDDEEFSREIEENENRYLITMNDSKSDDEMNIILEIINKLGRKFSVEDISEIFSVDVSATEKFLTNTSIHLIESNDEKR